MTRRGWRKIASMAATVACIIRVLPVPAPPFSAVTVSREFRITSAASALHLAVRIDTDKIPGALLRAYTQIETEARAQLNPSGFATKAQRQEAKEAARLRAEAEAADGRFRRLSHCPILWDGQSNTLYAGSTSTSVLERLQDGPMAIAMGAAG